MLKPVSMLTRAKIDIAVIAGCNVAQMVLGILAGSIVMTAYPIVSSIIMGRGIYKMIHERSEVHEG
jgi:hypothetical protein